MDFADDGMIQHIYYTAEGNFVKKGEILVELDNAEQKINLEILTAKTQLLKKKIEVLSALLEQQALEAFAHDESGNENQLTLQLARFLLIFC